MIHWKGRGYFVILIPTVISLTGEAVNSIFLDNRLFKNQMFGCSLVLSAMLIWKLLPYLQNLKQINTAKDHSDDVHYLQNSGKKESSFSLEKVKEFLVQKINSPNSFVSLPVEFFPYLYSIVGFGYLLYG